jgi:short-subunit dehydrogenase
MNERRDKYSILITGCSSGIGHALAHGLQHRGYRVFASARQAEDVERLAKSGFNALQLDLADTASITQAVETLTAATENRLYALVNNGAYGQPGAVEDLETRYLREQFETNLFGTHELTRQLIPVMRIQPRSHIIQISSIFGFMALPYRGAYIASKYALEALTDTMRLEMADSSIRLSLVEPGPITSRFRINAYHAFTRAIDPQKSLHSHRYQDEIDRMQSDKPIPFTLPAEAVLEKVIHALESRHPRVRYPVTRPAQVFKVLKRLLPDRWMDRVLLRVSGYNK